MLRPSEGQDVNDEKLDQAAEIIRRRIDSLGVAEPDVTRQGSNLVVQLPGVDDQQRAIELVGQTGKLEFRPLIGSSQLSCNERIVNSQDWIVPEDSPIALAGSYDVETIAGFNSQIDAAVAEVDDAEERGDLVRQPSQCANLTAAAAAANQEVEEALEEAEAAQEEEEQEQTQDEIDPADEPDQTDSEQTQDEAEEPAEPEATPEPEIDQEYNDYIVNRGSIITNPDNVPAESHVLYPDKTDFQKHLLGPSLLDGSALRGASAQLTGIATWIVQLNFHSGPEGIGLFNQAAFACFGREPECPNRILGITLDGVVETAPQVGQQTFDPDNIAIQGNLSRSEAEDLALILRYGALPLEFDDPSEAGLVRTVSATLGSDSLRAGIIAGSIGIALVALYMIFYYRLVGLAAILSLGVSGILLWVIISFLSETQGLALTLAGVTGLIVSIGVSLDSNVVYFENLKEDVTNGKTLRSSVSQSFPIAFKTIFWANLATLIGAAILWWLAIGSVRGFAVILGIASILDLIATYFFLRPTVRLLAHSRITRTRPRWLIGVADNAPS